MASSKAEALKLNFTSVLSPLDDVLSRQNADGTVSIMKLDNDKFFFTLDGIAAEAWGMVDGKSSLEVINDKLVKKHKPPVDRLRRDLLDLFGRLKKEKLITF